jgi:hypothetical protein
VKVTINNREITVFNGARVCDAVLAYSKDEYKMLMNGELAVTDHFGNITAADGSLTEGQVIRLRKKTAP